mmetsp:Transcript_58057/g.96279  ORF Transcript_58057/g.96279 Transcript_58057/m.96279 type:complete len:295 (-) Transcript_58057:689-1573(-)|eukprot:CAMPEP_0202695818 /NCGR_PEP_ID=MMETSP1385-20130828/9299_1 /ASSEMBLY_ACC=CAM_ASM_000861 /TAXON_ID=933848 /ORGANISM="Elphidium margaritaceum" /LENGTH=294 /DNA_ID=CAMNT_0049351895 /DNA_START=12 /DNA_END=896 /DNA_ORIENTATION=-
MSLRLDVQRLQMYTSFFVLIVWLMCSSIEAQPGGRKAAGVLTLDGYSFPKIVDGSHNVVVKFGTGNDYSEGAEQWDRLGHELMDKPDIVLAEVTLSSGGMDDDYDMYGYGGVGSDGDDETGNEQLLAQFNISPDSLPQFRLFLKGSDQSQPLSYSTDKYGDLLSFIQSNGIYLGLEGCLREFDDLAKAFVNSFNDQSKRDQVGETAKKEMNKYDAKGAASDEVNLKSAKYYIKVMAKMVASNNMRWVETEIERLAKILMSGNLNQTKQQWFQQRLNILSVFAGALDPDAQKNEL